MPDFKIPPFPPFAARKFAFAPPDPRRDSPRVPRTVYLDHNATTPLDAGVREAMLPFLGEVWGNPSSVHHIGRRARALLDAFRDRLAARFRCKPSEVVFTSGGTESNNLAVFGAARLGAAAGKRHLITSPTEHHAVLNAFEALRDREGFELTLLPVDAWGRVSPENLRRVLRPDTALVSVMAANNETGTVQPVAELGTLCRERGVLFHTDAVQWFGKLPVETVHAFQADLVSLCAHKIHGPKGAGALFIRSPLLPPASHVGGPQENERRAGTENLAAIAGLVEAVERFTAPPVFAMAGIRALRDELRSRLGSIEGVRLWTPAEASLPNTVAVSVEGADSIALLAGLDLAGVCASSGAACSAGSVEPSHVLAAQGASPAEANALIRFSLGREVSQPDITHAAEAFAGVVSQCRSAGAGDR